MKVYYRPASSTLTELPSGEHVCLGSDGAVTVAREPGDGDAEYEAAVLRAEVLVTHPAPVEFTRDAVTSGPAPSALLSERWRAVDAAFMRAIHPGGEGFLEVRAFRKDRAAAPCRFVRLPLTAERLSEIQGYARQFGDERNIYHAIATRVTSASGELANCSELWALYAEFDLKRGVPLQDLWRRVNDFALSPSWVLHSGGGLHVYWLLAEPLDLRTDLGLTRAYQWLGDLRCRLGAERESAEPAHVLRVPGTFNLKQEYGSPSPIVRVLQGPGFSRYQLQQVIEILGDADLTRSAKAFDERDQEPVLHGLDREVRLRIARSFLMRAPIAIAHQGGDQATYAVCCDLAIGHDLTEDDALQALAEWNTRCLPPWSERELRQKVRNAIRYGKGRRGAKLIEFPTTEAGDAEFFAEQLVSRARYDHRLGRWLLAGESGIWAPDHTEQLHQVVIELMRERQHRAMLLDSDKRKKLWNWAHNGESRKRITNTLALAKSVPPIADAGDDWDASPFLLGVTNGVVDLRTGVLRSARAEDRITMQARAAFNPAARCPLWEQTLSQIFAEREELTRFMQRAFGYSLTGDCREECLFLCWGDGRNGKGTLLNTIAWVLADYADNLSFSALEMHDRGSAAAASPDIAKLPGKRFVTASESGESSRFNEARVKAITGRDPITARPLYRAEFTFSPVAKFWLSTNKLPLVRDNSEGFWSRIRTVPFTESFLGRENMALKDRLREEASGILAWLVRGCLEWQGEGLNPPQAVILATDAYRRENEPLTPFLESCCVVEAGARTRASDLFHAYETWCEGQALKPWQRLNAKTFGVEIKKRFQVEEKRHRWYLGVGLRDLGRVNQEMF